MTERVNELGQPIGPALPGWRPRPQPPRTAMDGRLCRVEPIDVERHAKALFDADRADAHGGNWTYMFDGPFADFASFRSLVEHDVVTHDPLVHAIVDRQTDRAVGMASLMRIQPDFGIIEVGRIMYTPALQRTPAATEAMYLMMKRVFDELGYRRYEWKCDALNAPSRAAALRLGFRFEGIFRQGAIYKGRSRDTAWYAMIDADWPHLRAAYERWLDPSNFDGAGRQKVRLSALIADQPSSLP
jgi:RimJ/RimL family protein N-acetyltransferase